MLQRESHLYEEAIKRAKVIINMFDSGKIDTLKCYSRLYDTVVNELAHLCYSEQYQENAASEWQKFKKNVKKGIDKQIKLC